MGRYDSGAGASFKPLAIIICRSAFADLPAGLYGRQARAKQQELPLAL